MALITVLSTDGKPMLVHTSIFDPPRPSGPRGNWPAVWERMDAEPGPTEALPSGRPTK